MLTGSLWAHDSKIELVRYDYVDNIEPMLANMYRKRFKGYESMVYAIRDNAFRPMPLFCPGGDLS